MTKTGTKRSVGRQLTVLIILMIVVISSVMMGISYFRYSDATEKYYWNMGETTAGIISLAIDPDLLDTYLTTLEKDAQYERTLAILHQAKLECSAKTLYVFTMAEEGIHYIYDTGETDFAAELGDFDPFYYTDEATGELARLYREEIKAQLEAGGQVDTIKGITRYGWTITVTRPLYGKDGTCKGFVGIDFDVSRMREEGNNYLVQLGAVILFFTVVFAVIYTVIIRRLVIHPVSVMVRATDKFIANGLNSGESIGTADILSMEINTKDEFESLSEALKSMVRKIEEYISDLNAITLKSETDVLTGICNRGAFEAQVGSNLRFKLDQGLVSAFMMLDVDYFKAVNDNYGHAAGDFVLAGCAQALRKVMRETDIVGRLGGDEFAVFCKGIGTRAKAEQKAKQIREAWLKVIPPGSNKGITASIGIAFTPKDGLVYQDLFNKADEALYRVKEAGRDGYALSGAPPHSSGAKPERASSS
ncbi:diguanylate cyclase domain-containing protein [Breznakiellaceae bacterium SP9]